MAKKKAPVKKAATKKPSSLNKLADETKRKKLLFALLLLAIAVIIYFSRGLFVAATVNGKPIPRTTVIRELEKQGGKQVLEEMISKKLLFEEAEKRNIEVSEKEINDEVVKLEKQLSGQGQTLEQALQFQGLTRESLREEILVRKTVEKMFANDIKVSEEELNKFVEQNSESLPEGTNIETLRQEARQQLAQEKLNQKVQELIKNLRDKAKINYFVEFK